MTEQTGGAAADGLEPGEKSRLVHTLESRYAVHLEAAATAVRQAEQEVAQAQDRLAHATLAAANAEYRSDPLVFMREGVNEELDGLGRKTTAKKLRAAYRFLLDRSVELAAGEVQRFHDDLTTAQHERAHGLEACIEAERMALQTLEAARAMQERVRAAEAAARQGLTVLVDKLTEGAR